MNSTSERMRALIAEEAADWFVANRAGLTARERGAFSQWLKTSPLHVEEYLQLATLARDLPQACETSSESLEQLLKDAQADPGATVSPILPQGRAREARSPLRQGWLPKFAVAAALLLVAAGLLLGPDHYWRSTSVSADKATATRIVTGHGEQRTQTLADGSILHLNTDSAIEIRIGKTSRELTLLNGEAIFDVVHDQRRPFRVRTPIALVEDVGTQFDVRMQQGSTVVTVLVGEVSVAPASEPGPHPSAGGLPLSVAANQQVTLSKDDWPEHPVTVEASRPTAWLHRQIMFDHEPLERGALEFNRYSGKPIEIVAPELRSLEISGVFATDDVPAFVAFLRSLDGVRVEITDSRIRVSKR